MGDMLVMESLQNELSYQTFTVITVSCTKLKMVKNIMTLTYLTGMSRETRRTLAGEIVDGINTHAAIVTRGDSCWVTTYTVI